MAQPGDVVQNPFPGGLFVFRGIDTNGTPMWVYKGAGGVKGLRGNIVDVNTSNDFPTVRFDGTPVQIGDNVIQADSMDQTQNSISTTINKIVDEINQLNKGDFSQFDLQCKSLTSNSYIQINSSQSGINSGLNIYGQKLTAESAISGLNIADGDSPKSATAVVSTALTSDQNNEPEFGIELAKTAEPNNVAKLLLKTDGTLSVNGKNFVTEDVVISLEKRIADLEAIPKYVPLSFNSADGNSYIPHDLLSNRNIGSIIFRTEEQSPIVSDANNGLNIGRPPKGQFFTTQNGKDFTYSILLPQSLGILSLNSGNCRIPSHTANSCAWIASSTGSYSPDWGYNASNIQEGDIIKTDIAGWAVIGNAFGNPKSKAIVELNAVPTYEKNENIQPQNTFTNGGGQLKQTQDT